MLQKSLIVIVLLAIAACALCPPANACNTPVYRYAMYNWQTAPYIVFYFYESEVPEQDKAVHESIEKLTEEWPPEANVRLEPIDISDEKKMEALPEFVIEAWKSYEGGKTPAYVVFSPFRAHVYSGELSAESVQKLIDSPARQKLGQLLEEGNAAVMILLTCPDDEQNKKAEEALAGLRKMADSGEIPVELELPPMGLPGQEEDADANAEDAPNPNKLGIAVLKVDRNDPAEEFFVRMLMAVEDDLAEYADQPMIFAGYGRGRAMEPYIGKGITAENLVDVVAFLAGACSCMVKEQNPGADLLVKWNWEAAADKMAENDPSLDYGPYGSQGYGEFPAQPGMSEGDTSGETGEVAGASPSETNTSSEPPAESTTIAEAPKDASAAADMVAVSATDSIDESSTAEGGNVSAETEQASPDEGQKDQHEAVPESAVGESSAHESDVPSYSGRRMVTYGIGFGAIAIGVLLAGLALMMRRS